MFFVLSQLWDREKKSEFPRGIRIPRSDALLLSHRDWWLPKREESERDILYNIAGIFHFNSCDGNLQLAT